MVKIERDCVGCNKVFGYCRMNGCPYYTRYEVYICDECGNECDDLYIVGDKELCADCVLSRYERI